MAPGYGDGWAGLNWVDGLGDDTGPSVLQLTPRLPANTSTLTVEGIEFVGARLSLNISWGHAMLTLLTTRHSLVQVSFFPAMDSARSVASDGGRTTAGGAAAPTVVTLAVGQGVRVALGLVLNVSVSGDAPYSPNETGYMYM